MEFKDLEPMKIYKCLDVYQSGVEIDTNGLQHIMVFSVADEKWESHDFGIFFLGFIAAPEIYASEYTTFFVLPKGHDG